MKESGTDNLYLTDFSYIFVIYLKICVVEEMLKRAIDSKPTLLLHGAIATENMTFCTMLMVY